MTVLSFPSPIIAHRGASAYAPENTIVAFTKAVQLGAKWVECDVQLSSDSEVVVFHDTTLSRTTNAHGELKDFPWAYLQSLDAGMWYHPTFSSERIPSLQQTLTFLADKGTSLNIELKPVPGKEAALVNAVLKVTKSNAHLPVQLMYSSFCLKTLQYLRQIDNNAIIGFLMDSLASDWTLQVNELNAAAVNINHHLLTAALAKEVKDMKKALTCYTVNDVAIAKKLCSLGVDAFFTDKPDLL
jgi:glycerophosphoryl diester phosphodiesterase